MHPEWFIKENKEERALTNQEGLQWKTRGGARLQGFLCNLWGYFVTAIARQETGELEFI